MTMHSVSDMASQVPSLSLRLEPLPDGRPAVQSEQGPVFIYRANDEGTAYAKLAVEAFKLLGQRVAPANSSAAPEPGAGECLNSIESQMLALIEPVLALNAGFGKAPAKLLTKLIYAAIAPLVNPEAGVSRQVVEPSTERSNDDVASIRLEAVESFCEFLLERGDSHSIPSEDSLLTYANNWNAVSNKPSAGAHQ